MTAPDPRLDEIQARAAEAVGAAIAYCDEALRMCSADPEQAGYDQGFDDAIRGMAAKVKGILRGEAS